MRSNNLSSDEKKELVYHQADFRTHSELADGWGYLHKRKRKDKVKQGAWHHQRKLASKSDYLCDQLRYEGTLESGWHTDSSLADGYSNGWRLISDDFTEIIPPTTTDTSQSNCQSWLDLIFTVGLRLLAAFLAVIGGCLVLAFFPSDFTALFTLNVCIFGAGCVTLMLYLASRRATFSSWWLSYRNSKNDGSTLD